MCSLNIRATFSDDKLLVARKEATLSALQHVSNPCQHSSMSPILGSWEAIHTKFRHSDIHSDDHDFGIVINNQDMQRSSPVCKLLQHGRTELSMLSSLNPICNQKLSCPKNVQIPLFCLKNFQLRHFCRKIVQMRYFCHKYGIFLPNLQTSWSLFF